MSQLSLKRRIPSLKRNILSLIQKLLSLFIGGIISVIGTTGIAASEVEVLHWWTSGGEASSAELLKETMEQKNYRWKDFSVAGGGGQSAMMVLKARAVSGNPPTAAQIKGDDIQEWSQLGFLISLDDIAREENWDALLPEIISATMKYQGQYVAVPVNVHRVNWLWINPRIFKEVGVSIPQTLDEFFTVADAIKAAGYVPLAHGRQSWQDATVFESLAIAILGPQEYYKAFVELDMAVLSGKKMAEVFGAFKKMRHYIDDNALGRDWNEATQMMINGEAAMQILGDWVKGELTAMGKVAGEDFLCVAMPGTQGVFSYNIDSFVFFKSHKPSHNESQKALANAIISKPFQADFNFRKGSLPARKDVSLKGFDNCSSLSMKAFTEAESTTKLLPSFSHDMATTSYVRDAMIDVISEFFGDEAADPEKAPERLAKAVKAAM